MVAWLFPGQGSQQRGMGAGLFERFPDLVARADAELGYSVAELCRDDPDGRLRNTAYAQPALYVVAALTYLDLAERQPSPAFLAGHSLGEYAALFAAGCFDFTTGVRLVKRRGELMAQASGGTMLAVVGAAAGQVAELVSRSGRQDVDIANHNSAEQVVLSGPREALDAVAATVKRAGGRCVPLNVSAAFHSRYMAPAARAFAGYLAEVDLADPVLPVVANVTGEPYRPGTARDLLVAQIEAPVRWAQSMRYLLDHGVTEVVEAGPGTVLTGLWRAASRSYQTGQTGQSAAAAGQAVPQPQPQPQPRPQPQPQPQPHSQPPEPVPAPARAPLAGLTAQALGSAEFRRDYDVRYAYVAGSMYHGIASADLVVRMGRGGLLGFFGAGGLRPSELATVLDRFHRELGSPGRYGMNMLCTLDNPRLEHEIVDLYLRRGVRHVEAAAYPQITAPLVRYRFSGAHRDTGGRPVAVNSVLAKVSRPEVAGAFMRPPPQRLLRGLVAAGELTPDEAAVAEWLPVSGDVCVEADSAGHTDAGQALTLLPAMLRLRDEVMAEHRYATAIRVGAAGGLGAPEALAAVFVLGADFVVTGSVNQCSPQAGTSDAVKDLLATVDVQDTTYAPAGDLFELGAKVQVLRKGTLFGVRANKLYQLYRQYGALEDIDEAARRTVERDYFGRSFAEIWADTERYLAERHPDELERARRDPRRRMALVFRWYFRHSTEAALRGDPDARVNYQIHCGPALGAFNRWVRGTDLADWRCRHVDVIAERLMTATAQLLRDRFAALAGAGAA